MFASAQPAEVTTILGSCVAVCLWDRYLGIGGINHYMGTVWSSPRPSMATSPSRG